MKTISSDLQPRYPNIEKIRVHQSQIRLKRATRRMRLAQPAQAAVSLRLRLNKRLGCVTVVTVTRRLVAVTGSS